MVPFARACLLSERKTVEYIGVRHWGGITRKTSKVVASSSRSFPDHKDPCLVVGPHRLFFFTPSRQELGGLMAQNSNIPKLHPSWEEQCNH